MSERHKTVLAVSPDRQLAGQREAALIQSGFCVVSVHTEAAARFEIHFGRCGVLLLCHKLSRRVREALARDFHRLCPEPLSSQCWPMSGITIQHKLTPAFYILITSRAS